MLFSYYISNIKKRAQLNGIIKREKGDWVVNSMSIEYVWDGYKVYYLHNYIRKDQWDNCSKDLAETSEKILAYKSGNNEAIKEYTEELMQAIVEITDNKWTDKIVLAAIPASTKERDSNSSVKKSLRLINQWNDTGEIKSRFKCNKKIYCYCNLLKRTTDVATGHVEGKVTYAENKASITCTKENLTWERTAFIILDDITTRGVIMSVCRDILFEHGAPKNKIDGLAIAKTKWVK